MNSDVLRSIGTIITRFAIAIAAAIPLASHGGNEQVTGSVLFFDGPGFLKLNFSCTGLPTCTGFYSGVAHDAPCADFALSDGFTITGLDLSHPGSLSGIITIAHDYTSNGCVYALQSTPGMINYSASWNGTTGTFSSASDPLGSFGASGSFNASIAPPPVFPMTVTASVTAATVNVTAQIQPRPQDVGTTASVFVFVHAPLSMVHGTRSALRRAPAGPGIAFEPRDGPDPCVLAQVDTNGQLVGVTASTMQAITTGVLNSQGQSIAILTNVPTPNLAGVTLYVGYGPNASGMLANGVYQPVTTIPGASQCAANLANAPAPHTPGVLTGLWWNAAESGWGIHFTQRGSNVFAAWYTYDSAGKPKWYVSTCAGASGSSGSCSGTLYQVTGPNFFGGGFNPGQVNATNAGSLQVNFSNANAASMTYTVASQTRTVSLTRQPLASGTTPPAVDNSDIWWNPSESGWGIAMAQQYGITFVAWYVYDATGKPSWLVATCTMTGSSCNGTLYRTTGPLFGPTFNPSQVQATAAGTISVNFTDANNAILSYTVDGVSATKAVTRQLF